MGRANLYISKSILGLIHDQVDTVQTEDDPSNGNLFCLFIDVFLAFYIMYFFVVELYFCNILQPYKCDVLVIDVLSVDYEVTIICSKVIETNKDSQWRFNFVEAIFFLYQCLH